MPEPLRAGLTEGAHEVFALAHDLADELGHDDVTPAQFALGLVRVRLVAATALFNLGVALDVLEREIEEHLPTPGTRRTPARVYTRTSSDERIIDQAKAVARDLGTPYYGDEHLFLATPARRDRSHCAGARTPWRRLSGTTHGGQTAIQRAAGVNALVPQAVV